MRVAACCLVLLVATNVAAAEPGDAARADALFKEARALMKAGSFETACGKLEESGRLDPAAGTSVNLGDCLEKLGRLADALQAQRAALSLLQPGDPRIAPVKNQIANLERRVPRLTVTVASEVAGATVKLDGAELDAAKLATPLPVNPGQHTLLLEVPGRRSRTERVTVSEGQSREVALRAGEQVKTNEEANTSAVPSDGEEPASSGADSSDGSTQRAVGFVFGGAGIVGLGIGAFSWYRAGVEADRAEATCPSSPCDASNIYNSQRAEEESNRSRANVAFLVGGLALAGGAALVLTAPAGSPQTARRALRFSSSASPQHVDFHVGGAW